MPVRKNYETLSLIGRILSYSGGYLDDRLFGGVLPLYRKLAKFPDSALVLDHPSKPQFTVYERDDYDWSLENDID